MNTRLLPATLLAVLALSSVGCRQAESPAASPATASSTPSSTPLTASNAWIREAPPTASAMAGFVTLHNASDQAIRCDGASGVDFGAAELHRTVTENGVSRMLPHQVVEVPAHGEARLEPGSYHIMLFRWSRPLVAGDHSTLTLNCGAHPLTVEFEVRNAF